MRKKNMKRHKPSSESFLFDKKCLLILLITLLRLNFELNKY